jgi:hypothetical protein
MINVNIQRALFRSALRGLLYVYAIDITYIHQFQKLVSLTGLTQSYVILLERTFDIVLVKPYGILPG